MQGLTLIELLVTLAAAIIVVAIGIPMFQTMASNNRAVSQANGVVLALNMARSEAVKRGARVTVCAVADAAAANPVCDNSTDWANGWLVFVDDDGDGTTDAGEQRLRVWPALTGSNATSQMDFVTFNGMGVVSPAPVPYDNNKLTYLYIEHPDSGLREERRCIILQASGQIATDAVDFDDSGENCP